MNYNISEKGKDATRLGESFLNVKDQEDMKNTKIVSILF
jgi:hypothetical protein